MISSPPSLIAYYSIAKKTIQQYVEEIIRHDRYRTIVSQVNDGTVLDDRSRLMDIYDSCYVQDAHLRGVVETLYSQLTGERYMLARMDSNGKWEIDPEESKKAQGIQFEKIIKGILDSKLYGYSLIEIINEVDKETGLLREVNIIERRNVLADQRRVIKRAHQWDPGWNIDSETYRHNYILVNNDDLGLSQRPLLLYSQRNTP